MADASPSPVPVPVGTVSFVLTDVEGSTRLWQAHPDEMAGVIARQRVMLSEVVGAHEGWLPRDQGEGDSVFAVFDRTTDAVRCAVEIQRAISSERWPHDIELRLRVAVHTGEADLRDGNYYGTAVHRCARLRDAASGGQVLVSQATADLVSDALPPGAELRDLGLHRLKDLARPERVFELRHPDLPSAPGSLRSVDVMPNNLPVQLTSFVGRAGQIAEVTELVRTTRLLTLTGAGGCGKSRLAVQVGAEVLDHYPDGVWLVQLASLSDPELVDQAVADALGIPEDPDRPVADSVRAFVRHRRLLLILDNCEHLIEACAALAGALLSGSEGLEVLATSRESLGLAGENTYLVPSLTVPPRDRAPGPAELEEWEAVRLFVDRAKLSNPRFTLDEDNAELVAQICTRLDGIPLAIELAAAWMRGLSPRQLATKLDDRFKLLAGGRAALPRHQTLKATLDWSYDLLTDPAKPLLARLSVFAGGFTLEAAESVCSTEEVGADAILPTLIELVDKSLVNADFVDGDQRYSMLETMRQYGQDRLLDSGEAEQLRDRHLAWFVELAERGGVALRGPDQKRWLDELEREHDNLRAAVQWAVTQGRPDPAIPLTAALWPFWMFRGHHREGRRWLSETLALGAGPMRARALAGAGTLSVLQADEPQATRLLEEALTLAREEDDAATQACALRGLAMCAQLRGDWDSAATLLSRSLEAARRAEDRWEIAETLYGIGVNAMLTGDRTTASEVWAEGLDLRRAMGDAIGLAECLSGLATIARFEGETVRARELLSEGLALQRELGDVLGTASTLVGVAWLHHVTGEHQRARTKATEAVELATRIDARAMRAQAMWTLALIEVESDGDRDKARGLIGEATEIGRQVSALVLSQALYVSARLHLTEGDLETATLHAEEALAAARQGQSRPEVPRVAPVADEPPPGPSAVGTEATRVLLGSVALHAGDAGRARSILGDTLRDGTQRLSRLIALECIEALAAVDAASGHPRRAAMLLGACRAVREACGLVPSVLDADAHERVRASVHDAMGAGQAREAERAGSELGLERAVELALSDPATSPGPGSAG